MPIFIKGYVILKCFNGVKGKNKNWAVSFVFFEYIRIKMKVIEYTKIKFPVHEKQKQHKKKEDLEVTGTIILIFLFPKVAKYCLTFLFLIKNEK